MYDVLTGYRKGRKRVGSDMLGPATAALGLARGTATCALAAHGRQRPRRRPGSRPWKTATRNIRGILRFAWATPSVASRYRMASAATLVVHKLPTTRLRLQMFAAVGGSDSQGVAAHPLVGPPRFLIRSAGSIRIGGNVLGWSDISISVSGHNIVFLPM